MYCILILLMLIYWKLTSHVNCDDATTLNENRSYLATLAKWAIDDCFRWVCVQGIQQLARCKRMYEFPLITIFGQSWSDSAMIVTRDCVTRENHWRIASLVTEKSLFTLSHVVLYTWHLIGSISVNNDFGQSWSDSPMIITHESPLVTENLLFTLSHIVLYTWHLNGSQHSNQPFRGHVRKFLLINIDFNMDFYHQRPMPTETWCSIFFQN